MSWRVEVKVIGPHGYHLRTFDVQEDLLVHPGFSTDRDQDAAELKVCAAFVQCYKNVFQDEQSESRINDSSTR